MKVCHIANYLPPYHKIWGGAEQGAIRIIELMRDKGHETIVCTCKHELDNHVENVVEYELQMVNDVKERTHLNKGFSVPKYKYYLNPKDKIVYKQLLEIFKKEKPDICHFHNIDQLSFSTIKAAKKLKIPSIITLYDYWVYCSKKILLDNNFEFCRRYNCKYCVECSEEYFPFWKNIAAKFSFKKAKIAKKMLNYCGGVHVLSNNSKNISLDYGIKENKLLVLPTFYDLKNTQKTLIREKNHIIFVGWFLYHKGIHVIIEAIGILKNRFPDIKFTAFGEALGENKTFSENLYKRIKELRIEKNVVLAGKVPFSTVEKHLKTATAITISEQWHNMGPVILLEALAHKIPVVASNLGAMPEMIEHLKEGLIAEYNNPEDWAEKLEYIIKNPAETKKIAEAGYEKVQSYCNEKNYFDSLDSLYDKVIKENT